MGIVANVIPGPNSGEMENVTSSEILVQSSNCEHPDPVNYEMTSEMVITEPVELKIVRSAQNRERRLFEGIDTNDGEMNILAKNSSIKPECGTLEQLQTSAAVDSDHMEDKDKRMNPKSRNSKSEIISSWVLRSKSQDKPKASETDDTMNIGNSNVEKGEKERKRKRAKSGPVNEFSRTRTHLRYLLHRIKCDQSLIDAYSAEGWKGQSAEKLKPEKELQQARSNILRDKLRIRELFKNLDLSLAVGKIPESSFDSLGEIGSEDIFCAKCGSKDLSLENDIILCDGACERGFHQYCLEPPLLKSQIPPDDEGWLCPGCDCKVDCTDILKDFEGANFSISDNWEKIFPEAVQVGKKTEYESGSTNDSENDDSIERTQGDKSSSDKSNYFSAPDDLAADPNDNKCLGFSSDDSADDDFDPTASDQDKQVKLSSSSSDFTSDSEDLGALLDDVSMPDIDAGHVSPSSTRQCLSIGSEEKCPNDSRTKNRSLNTELAYLMKTGGEPVTAKRPIQRLDYKKLLEETYGDTSDSSDEDFDDKALSKRKKRSLGKTAAVSSDDESRTTESNTYSNGKNLKEGKCSPCGMPNSVADGKAIESSADTVSLTAGSGRRIFKRLGEAATQRLYESFKENRFPSRAVKENLAEELNLTVQKVSKWFENARWSFNHRPKMESNTSVDPQRLQVSNVEGNAVPAETQTPETGVENLVPDSGVVNKER